ncbi:MAG: flavodoxin-dependent (E)-4-hydroxy-3-methylbut-2-enyl-diphosphate synthase [Candidatus Omnitrophica bacterium]|nr:flavodoxin-dependent (E)-4-hydroxy-3-methylbut-2-enyl-diphosphate synthase [Candidatus Omnitrophota bacterium]
MKIPQELQIRRKRTRSVDVGGVGIGGENPVRIQSMCNTPTEDVKATVEQIKGLADAGCELVRVAVPDEAAARSLGAIKRAISIPLIADIHFHWKYALIALEEGVDKLRLNPGNIGERARVESIVEKAKVRGVPIRIGVNAGSLEKSLLKRDGRPTPEAMLESGLNHIRILEEMDFQDIVLSMKASNIPMTVAAYRLASQNLDYPLHLGVTEAGTLMRGTVQSAAALGALLLEGIGDTLRISLTADSVEEVRVAKLLLESLGLRKGRAKVISCPSCGRADVDVFKLADEVEKRAQEIGEDISIAVLGCEVNGPGESREADFGIAGGRQAGALYVNGVPVRKVEEDRLVDELFDEIKRQLAQRRLSGESSSKNPAPH